MKKYYNIFSLTISFIYFEFLFDLLIYKQISNIAIKLIFIIIFCLFINMLLEIIKKPINKILKTIMIIFLGIITYINYIYFKIFEAPLSLFSIIKGTEVFKLKAMILKIILSNWFAIFLFIIIPSIVSIVFEKKINKIEKISKKSIITYIIIIAILYSINLFYINYKDTNQMYSSKNLYFNLNNPTENYKKLGLITSTRLDLQRTILGFKEKELYEYKDNNGNTKVLDSSKYNMFNINFKELINKESTDEIKEIHEYFANQEPTEKNEYTGIFEGKNLVIIVGESFSSLAIKREITPTLYKIANSGFVFENFYTPLFPISTADGEFIVDNSLVPAENLWSMTKVADNEIPFSCAKLLKEKGYVAKSYHNYDYNYYSRDKYMKALGLDTYLAKGNGLEERINLSGFPNSDYDMLNATIDDYINSEHFFAYYMTMSGHINYDKTNNMVVKNWDKVKDLPYSENCKGYLATQIELDKAVEELLIRLEKSGKLDDTVIVMCGDHYPYGLSESEMKELSPHDMTQFEFEKFHMPLIIYNSKVKTTSIKKLGSSLDILPTVLNLFGLDFDSRLLMGRDLLSNSEPLVFFSYRTFITNKGRYNSKTEQFENFDVSNEFSKEKYLEKINEEIYKKYRISRLILSNDYYKYLQIK